MLYVHSFVLTSTGESLICLVLSGTESPHGNSLFMISRLICWHWQFSSQFMDTSPNALQNVSPRITLLSVIDVT